MAKTEKKLSQILAETFEKYLYAENKPIDTLIDFDRIKDVLPIPSVNGVDTLERNLTDANKDELIKVVQDSYITKDYGKLMDFLSYAFPISYSNKGETITTMYNALRKQLGKSEYYELTYDDMTKIFETGKPLERINYDAGSFTKQILKKGKKGNLLNKEDKIRFLIQGYKVARFYESHTDEMEHFRTMQEHFYKNNKKGISSIDTEMLKDLGELGFTSDDILLLRQTFYKGGSKDSETFELISGDVSKPSSALDSIEMKNVVDADNVLRSIFIGKYVKERLADKIGLLSYDSLDEDDQKIFASFMSPNGENVESILTNDVDMYAKCINSLVNKLFKEKYDIVKYKPYLSKSGEDGWELEEYSDKELASHKKNVRDAIVKSAISNGAFVTSSKEEFMKKLAIACTDKQVTKHFCHAGVNAIARDADNNFIDFESTFPDAANAPYASQNRKRGNATINYEGTLYYVTGVPVVATGNTADNIVDDEWALSITDQELNALIVNLTNKYGISFGNLKREDFTVGKNMAAFESSKMALGKDAKVSIETAFEMAKKPKTQEEERKENPYVHNEDTVRDFTSYKDTSAYKEAYNKAMAEYKSKDSLIELIAAVLPKLIDKLQGGFAPVYSDKAATLENSARYEAEARDAHLEAHAIEEEARDEALFAPTSDAPYRKDMETLHPEEKHAEPNQTPTTATEIKVEEVKTNSTKTAVKEDKVVESKVKKVTKTKTFQSDPVTLEPLTKPGEIATANVGDEIELSPEMLAELEEQRKLLGDYELYSDGHWAKVQEKAAESKKETSTRSKKATVKKSTTKVEKQAKSEEISVYQLRNSTNIEIDGQNYFVMKGVIYDSNFKEVSRAESERVKQALENNMKVNKELDPEVQPNLPWNNTEEETIEF